jgi:L-alanine-DL-glutamate epimerase-like enolase superfamily enzyme
VSRLAEVWAGFEAEGHPIEIRARFFKEILPQLLKTMNQPAGTTGERMPWLAALVCCSPFDIAMHDAYGQLHRRPVYETYGPEFMNHDLAHFLTPADGSQVSFADKYPPAFLVARRPDQLRAWHLVGGLDPLRASDLTGSEPKDDYPILLTDWIRRDGLKCLKIKLRGNDAEWDYQRVVEVGKIAMEWEWNI